MRKNRRQIAECKKQKQIEKIRSRFEQKKMKLFRKNLKNELILEILMNFPGLLKISQVFPKKTEGFPGFFPKITENFSGFSENFPGFRKFSGFSRWVLLYKFSDKPGNYQKTRIFLGKPRLFSETTGKFSKNARKFKNPISFLKITKFLKK